MNPYSLLLFAAFLLMFHLCHSQNITDEGNRWNVRYSAFGPNVSTSIYRIGDETVIDGVAYKEVLYSTDESGQDWLPSGTRIREEGQKVYWLSSDGEALLYDFSAEVGDTLDLSFPADNPPCRPVVTSVDSVMLNNGEWRKRMTVFSGLDEATWVEGIGSTGGLLSGNRQLCWTDYGWSLLCFHHNDLLLYPENPPTCFVVSTDEPLLPAVRVFPNPASSEIVVEGGDRIATLRLYHADGRLALERRVAAEQARMTVSHLPKGIYSLSLVMETGRTLALKIAVRH